MKFLNDTGGGVVKEIKDSKMAVVLADDGFEFPVLISELVPVSGPSGNEDPAGKKDNSAERQVEKDGEKPVFIEKPVKESLENARTGPFDQIDPYGRGFSGDAAFFYDHGESPSSGYEEKPARLKAERNLLLGIVESKSKEEIEVWLINDSRFSVLYTFLQKDGTSYINLKTGHVESDTRVFISEFSREQVNAFITLRLQALFFMKGIYEPAAPSEAEYKIDPVAVYSDRMLAVNDFFDDNAMIVPLISDRYESEVKKIEEQKTGHLTSQKKDGPSSSRTGREKPETNINEPFTEEVDLHIEELVENHSALSGREVLDIQMARFTTALEGALRGKTKRIVFIHGIGNGKLKFEIRKTLDKKYSRLKYQDASFKEYGYGATLVFIRR